MPLGVNLTKGLVAAAINLVTNKATVALARSKALLLAMDGADSNVGPIIRAGVAAVTSTEIPYSLGAVTATILAEIII